ncbi:MAG: hypothetical protein JO257_29965 [Deltaproteobacteria bacterium]|nr:hypothetical protein [Deltaproteobacteria bacterium]
MSLLPAHKAQIEDVLGRELAEEELAPAAGVDALTDTQLNVVAQLSRREHISPTLYIRGVVPGASFEDAKKLILGLGEVLAKRQGTATQRGGLLNNEHLFEDAIGRPLHAAERQRAAAFDLITGEARALAVQLASQDPVIAMLYVSAIVPTAPTRSCEAFVDQLLLAPPR